MLSVINRFVVTHSLLIYGIRLMNCAVTHRDSGELQGFRHLNRHYDLSSKSKSITT